MQWFYNMKIAKKLILSFGLMAILAGAVGYVGITKLKQADKSDTELYVNMTVPISQLGDMGVAFQRIRVNTRDIVMASTDADRKQFADRIQSYRSSIDSISVEYEKTILSEEMRSAFAVFKEARRAYGDDLDNLIQLAETDRDQEALALLNGEMKKSADDENAAIDKLQEMKIVDGKNKSDNNSVAANAAMKTMIIILVIAVIFAMGMGIFIARIIANPVKELSAIADKLALGDVNVKLEVTTQDEIGDLTLSFGKMVENIRENADAAKEIAAGNLNVEIEAKSSQDVLARSMQQVITSLRNLVSEAALLTKASVEGKLDTRGNAEKFSGGYREIMKGMNDTLDAIIGPLNMAAEYVDRISKGDIPPKITDTYHGDFNEIKNNLNRCIEAVGLLVSDANMLSQAAVEGRLDTRADATKHQGDFRRIIQGVNDTLDAVIGPLNVAAEYVDRISKGDIPQKITDTYHGDFNEIKNNLNQCIDGLGGLVEANAVLEKMADNDLTSKMAGEYQGIFHEVKLSLNKSLEAINDILSQVNVAADQVVSGAQQVSDASQSLSQGATEQASSLEEITASMTEMTSQTKQNADNAQQANKLAAAARDNAQTGNERMREMLAAMQEINESSGQISKIIKVIDEIAFQTNLLALNAAVEAARAGVHGKGFAVVADEVRNLAQRSAKAAKETTELIETSIKKVDNGTGIANETAKALNEIVSGVTKVTDLVGEIASASNEQAQGIGQVNQGLGQVDQVTQANTANAEESASAAEELSGQAVNLKQMIGRFTLADSGRMAPAGYGVMRPERASAPDRTGVSGGNGKKAKGFTPAAPGNGKSRKGAPERLAAVNPAEVIALDDNEFGKY